jgi:hypothetical protein
VYEGSYWALLGDCEELLDTLKLLAKAPPLLEEPPLLLPPYPDLPSWDEYRPELHVIPAAPELPVLRLPPFKAPILQSILPFMAPELDPLPYVPPAPEVRPALHLMHTNSW